MLGTERERMTGTLGDCEQGNETGSRFIWHRGSKTIRQDGGLDPDNSNLPITRKDMGFSHDRR